MRNILFLLFLIFSFQANSLLAQSIEKLDEKNGFKSFKIGDNKSKYEGNLTFSEFIAEDKITVYSYSGNEPDLYLVFDTKIDFIKLFFDSSNKLIGISLYKKYSPNGDHFGEAINDNKILLNNFEELFGKANGKIDVTTSKVERIGFSWTSKNLVLEVTVNYWGLKVGSGNAILIFKKSYLRKKLDSGF